MNSHDVVVTHKQKPVGATLTPSITQRTSVIPGKPTPLIVVDSGLDRYRWVVRSSYIDHAASLRGLLQTSWQGRSRIIVDIYRQYSESELGYLEIRVESEERLNENYSWESYYSSSLGDALQKEFLLRLRQYLSTGQ